MKAFTAASLLHYFILQLLSKMWDLLCELCVCLQIYMLKFKWYQSLGGQDSSPPQISNRIILFVWLCDRLSGFLTAFVHTIECSPSTEGMAKIWPGFRIKSRLHERSHINNTREISPCTPKVWTALACNPAFHERKPSWLVGLFAVLGSQSTDSVSLHGRKKYLDAHKTHNS